MIRAFSALLLVAAICVPTGAQAQDGNFLDRILGGRDRSETDATAAAQNQSGELVVRIDRLEAQIRQLTGTIEQLQFRNQQLEQQLQRAGGGSAQAAQSPVQQPPVQQARPPVYIPPQPATPSRSAVQPAPGPVAPGAPGRRSDVFDPSLSPNAPGAPRPLGSPDSASTEPPGAVNDGTVGAPGGRAVGAPLDLSTLATNVPRGSTDPAPALSPNSPLPAPPSRNTNATGAAMASVHPPTETSQGYYDLAYGYMLRKDYAMAEDAFHTFLKKYPNDKLVPDAHFWLGESLFQRQRYDGAAEAFLAVSTKHEGHGKAAESLLRLGQSLAALGQKEMSCATLAEVGRKYPRAPNNVKQGVEREQKRVRC